MKELAKPRSTNEAERIRTRRIGLAVFAFFGICLLALVLSDSLNARGKSRAYEKSVLLFRELIAHNPGACEKIPPLRKSLAKELRKARVTNWLMNKKAVVYLQLLNQAEQYCRDKPPALSPADAACNSPQSCRDKALTFFWNNHLIEAKHSLRQALGYKEDEALRQLLKLIEAIESDAVTPIPQS